MKLRKIKRYGKPVHKKGNNFRGEVLKIELSDRKKQIIKLICRQLTSKEIGEKLGLSVRTVEVHRLNLFKQIKVKNNVGVAIWAIKNGFYEV
jgi:two-component system, NarL family, invasion response regulator UvrY